VREQETAYGAHTSREHSMPALNINGMHMDEVNAQLKKILWDTYDYRPIHLHAHRCFLEFVAYTSARPHGQPVYYCGICERLIAGVSGQRFDLGWFTMTPRSSEAPSA